MDHVEFGDIAVEYEVTGQGDQVALLHASPFVGWYAPLVDVLGDYSVLRYRRTVPLGGRPFSIEDDATVCAQLLGHVGFDRPHVVGHSYGALLALALARDHAATPRTIALLEPATSGLLDPEQATAGLAPLMEMYRTQGPAATAEQFVGVVLGEDARGLLDRFLPGALDEAVATSISSSRSSCRRRHGGASVGTMPGSSISRFSTSSGPRACRGSCRARRSSSRCSRTRPASSCRERAT